MQTIPNSLAVFGGGQIAADVTIRNILRFKDTKGAVAILDYTGRGALILGETNKMSLLHREVVWCDLSDRLKPVSLFHMKSSEHCKQVLRRVLAGTRTIARMNVSDATLDFAADAGCRLSKNGTIGLGALLKSLSSPEVRRLYLDSRSDAQDLQRLLAMLSWSLAYPAVYGISEGVNRPELEQLFRRKAVLWVECRTECFEKIEHHLTAILLDAAVENAVRNIAAANERPPKTCLMTIAHLFPPIAIASDIPAWVRETCALAKNVMVYRIAAERALNPIQLQWAKQASMIWITGKISALKKSAHSRWLSETELERINCLKHGEVWVKSNVTGKAIVGKVRQTEPQANVAYNLRYQCAKTRKPTPVRQVASALPFAESGGNDDLYQKLRDKEMLRLGWFKIQNARKNSHGVDNVTIAQFKANLDDELSKLAAELTSREYRCRPLYRVRISKTGGGTRFLGIPCVRDRVAQAACLVLLEPIFEASFSHYSFAFRPHRRAHQALAMARSMISAGRGWVVTADIRKCFDNIDHDVLMRLVSRQIADQDMLSLIRHWLTVDVLDFGEFVPVEIGVPQGASISPLLANVYLDPLDKHFEQTGISFVRYADDIVILSHDETEDRKQLEVMKNFLLEPLHLELRPAKTNIAAAAEGFGFLGFKVTGSSVAIKQEKVEEIQNVLLELIKQLGDPAGTLGKRLESLVRINEVVRGWRNYFAIPDEKPVIEQLHFLDGRVDEMSDLYLPLGVKDDPAWLTRERFLIAGTGAMRESDHEAEERAAKAGAGYPEHNSHEESVRSLAKDGATDEDKTPLSSMVVEGGSDKEGECETAAPESVVEDGDRLYVLTHGSYLTVDGNYLVIKKKKKEVRRRPLDQLGLVYLQGFGINISVSLQVRLAELDVLLVLAPPIGEPMAVLNPIRSNRSYLRGLQVLRRDDPDVIATGLKIIASKITNQAAVLKYFTKYRKKTDPELGRCLSGAADMIQSFAESVLAIDPSGAMVRTEAMGYEGHAASIYWQQITRMVPLDFGFVSRITKSAQDLVNQCLNYVYGILYGEVWRAIVKAGLDPYFGLMHGSKRDQGSLVFDLIEEFRAPFADRLVIGMLGRGFMPELGDHGFLKTRAKRQLAVSFSKRWMKKIEWRSRNLEPAAILEKQANSLVKLMNREGEYHPYRMRW